MKRILWASAAMGLVAACSPAVPDSAASVGFDNYDRQAREAALNDGTRLETPAINTTPLDGTNEADRAREAALNSGVAPVRANPNNPAPELVTQPNGISQENDFNAVSGTRSIQDDAALREKNIANYTQVEPTALPSRSGTDGPNIVAYALETNHPVGQKLHRRNGFRSDAKHVRACRSFDSADLAQEAFLEKGGPQRDRLGLDPDGDGYACDWNPAPFRLVRQ